jgi:MOSC domain-containing protein YiiM
MMLCDRQTLADLQQSFPPFGRVVWLGLRPEPRAAVLAVSHLQLIEAHGPNDDHRAGRSGGKRQVTLLQFEHLAVIAALLNRAAIDPATLRRNILVSGINLLALRTTRFSVGGALLEGSGHCHPCSRMEENLGSGGYSAMRGHGGITARVVRGGLVHLGDPVAFVELVTAQRHS